MYIKIRNWAKYILISIVTVTFVSYIPVSKFARDNQTAMSGVLPSNGKQLNEWQSNTHYRRLDTTPEQTDHLPFLKNFKNPCWREISKENSQERMRIRCLPYFYLVGAPKCGTTELNKRLTTHPLISAKPIKEVHWLTRKRFLQGTSKNLSDYLRYFDYTVEADILPTQRNGYHNTIFGDSSASTLWDNFRLLRSGFSTNMTSPQYTNADVIYNLNPNAKILIMLRNPIRRLYSEYVYFARKLFSDKMNVRAADFHQTVVNAIECFTSCLKNHTLRYCADSQSQNMVRLGIGIYYIYIEDYFRVFPREQIKIITLEGYSQNKYNIMRDVFNFLEVGMPPAIFMETILHDDPANAQKEYTEAMWPQTIQLLYELYKPYNQELVKLLGSEFDYN